MVNGYNIGYWVCPECDHINIVSKYYTFYICEECNYIVEEVPKAEKE